MKKVLFAGIVAAMMFAVAGCGNKNVSDRTGVDSLDEEGVVDTALYGSVGQGTSMHSLEVIDENGKATTYKMDIEPTDGNSSDVESILGGVFSGDRVTFCAKMNDDGEMSVTKLVNLTSLCGRWQSLDRNFTLKEDGTVESSQPAETKPYTQWSMVNCNIVLNTDTFVIDHLGPDSLELENSKGIFVYKRQR